jgi:Fe-S-cluster containining protein
MKPKEFREKILKEYPRMTKNDKFTFACHPGVSCFNKCCNDVNIFLTPYDIARLRSRLGISSSEFLEKYTILPIEENLKHPIVMLKMEDDTLNCHLVSDKGCTVYEDRPWACRMYPIGVASPNEVEEARNEEEFYFLLKEDVCEGFKEGREWSVMEWMDDQGIKEYNEIGKLFKEISLHKGFIKNKKIEPVKLEMFFMACYDIDKFRDFLYESTFFKRFDVEKEKIEKMKTDDVELLKFGFDWIKYSLFGEKTMKVRDEDKVLGPQSFTR